MYQALYRQYRPKTFDEVLGQKHITITLKNQIQKENIGHAYLFSGTRGTGKTSTAKIFSRAVNCLNSRDGNPCNECEICKGILDESIMDVIEMDAASNRRIDDIRELRDKVIYPPARTKYKVYIIDEVHMLTPEAFNALLKTLEEPPKHLIFILATTEPEKLPQTILSRCQRFDFKRVTTKDIIENMKNICSTLSIDVEDKVLNLIARNSDGAMRDALSLLDQCVSFGSGEITYSDAISILGIVNTDMILNIVQNIIDKNLENVLQSIDEVIQNGKDIHQFIKDLINHFRNLMIIKTSKNPVDLIDIDEESLNKYLNQSKNISIGFILRGLDILVEADEKAKWSTQPRVILEMASIQLTKLEEELSLEERVKRLEQGIKTEKVLKEESVTYGNKSAEIRKEQTEKEKPTVDKQQEVQNKKEIYIDDGKELQFETIVNDWQNVLQAIKAIKVNVFALLMEGEPISYSGNVLTIGYKPDYGIHRAAISTPANADVVNQGISAYFKKNIDVRFTMIGDKPIDKKEEKDNKEKAIKEVIDFFGENIVEIK
ncbi:DNA polymerase III subunit gamma/tau [Tissierella carlieri]|uniref:DNA-directed DNA polymerase n=1 Tax=Tissierella carlieri TaxID=689904 RepID=A0ABT1S7M4_9FIRM|nr:DNA polymerase III subunit gamma/tau [Tissierella carlieri]MBU5312708.1 DNA polymerase III subunit gamma/tau [Tissierella carlieri]MCQ4922478.1 DNA polymerase III subunit gamma/tau [Tissierella carlieri]